MQIGNGGREGDPFHELTVGKKGEVSRLVNMALTYGFDTVIFRMPYGQQKPTKDLERWYNPKGLGWKLHPDVARVMGWLPRHVDVFCYEGASNMWSSGRIDDGSFRMRPLKEHPHWEKYIEEKCREMAEDGFDGIIHDVFHRSEDTGPGGLTKFLRAIERGAPRLQHVGEPSISSNAPKHLIAQIPNEMEMYRVISAPGRERQRVGRPYLDEIPDRARTKVRVWYQLDVQFVLGGERMGGGAEPDEWERVMETVTALNAKDHHAVVVNWLLPRR